VFHGSLDYLIIAAGQDYRHALRHSRVGNILYGFVPIGDIIHLIDKKDLLLFGFKKRIDDSPQGMMGVDQFAGDKEYIVRGQTSFIKPFGDELF